MLTLLQLEGLQLHLDDNVVVFSNIEHMIGLAQLNNDYVVTMAADSGRETGFCGESGLMSTRAVWYDSGQFSLTKGFHKSILSPLALWFRRSTGHVLDKDHIEQFFAIYSTPLLH